PLPIRQNFTKFLRDHRPAAIDRSYPRSVTDRRQLAKAIAALGRGDEFLVTPARSVTRSTWDLLNVLANVANKAASVFVRPPMLTRLWLAYVKRVALSHS